MNNLFNKATYIRKDGSINFPNLQANLKVFVDTVWQRSAEDNAKGFQFFAELWREPGLKHRGVLEGRARPVEPKPEVVEKATKSTKSKK